VYRALHRAFVPEGAIIIFADTGFPVGTHDKNYAVDARQLGEIVADLRLLFDFAPESIVMMGTAQQSSSTANYPAIQMAKNVFAPSVSLDTFRDSLTLIAWDKDDPDRAFYKWVREIAKSKPVVIIKTGNRLAYGNIAIEVTANESALFLGQLPAEALGDLGDLGHGEEVFVGGDQAEGDEWVKSDLPFAKLLEVVSSLMAQDGYRRLQGAIMGEPRGVQEMLANSFLGSKNPDLPHLSGWPEREGAPWRRLCISGKGGQGTVVGLYVGV
jgi:hypothetical protein